LEFHIKLTPSLQTDFAFIAQYQSDSKNHIRNERLQRLQSFEWQLNYTFCFYAIMQDCYARLDFKNKTDQLAFFFHGI